MQYLKRMFSWQGNASRKEFIGFYLSYFSIAGLLIWLAFFAVLLHVSSDHSGIKMLTLTIAASSTAVFCLAVARRMRACAISPWWALLFFPLSYIPRIGKFISVLMFLWLLITPTGKDKTEDSPTFLSANIVFFSLSCILPFILLFTTVTILKPKKGAELPKTQTQAESPAPLPVVNSIEKYLPPTEKGTKPSPAATKTAAANLPAPEVSVLAQTKQWVTLPQACSSVCRENNPAPANCREMLTADKQWKLCLQRSAGRNPTFSQTLVNRQGRTIEKITFSSDKQPLWMVHFYKSEPKEIFINLANSVFFYIIDSPSFELDESTLLYKHPPYMDTKVSLQIHPDGQWNLVRYNKDGSSVKYHNTKQPFSTPWKGFQPSFQYLQKAFPR